MLTQEQIQEAVIRVTRNYNASSPHDKVNKVSLFGSYASQQASEASDVDLLVEFDSAFVSFFSLGRLLSEYEEALNVSVDVVPAPLPENSFIAIEAMVPLYAEER